MAAEFNRRIYDFGQNIRNIRQKRGMSQTDLALAMDTNKTVISRWETGERVIKLDSLLRLADVLEVSPSGLFCTPEPEEDGLKELTGELRKVPEKDMDFIFRAVRTLIRGVIPGD